MSELVLFEREVVLFEYVPHLRIGPVEGAADRRRRPQGGEPVRGYRIRVEAFARVKRGDIWLWQRYR